MPKNIREIVKKQTEKTKLVKLFILNVLHPYAQNAHLIRIIFKNTFKTVLNAFLISVTLKNFFCNYRYCYVTFTFGKGGECVPINEKLRIYCQDSYVILNLQ